MYISTDEWEKYINKLSALNTKAAESIQEWVAKNGFSDRQALIDYAYAVATKYGEGSATLSAQMYDAIAELEGATAIPAAIPAETATYSEVAKTVNGVLKRSLNVNTISDAIGALVKRSGADTMLFNARRDGAQYAWIPSGDTCPFCLMLASNGWQYMSKDAMQGKHAEHIHSNCDCTYAVRFKESDNVPGYDPDAILERFEDMKETSWQDRINKMRRDNYAKNKDEINAQKREAYAKRVAYAEKGDTINAQKGGEHLAEEKSLRSKGGEYGVDWSIVRSKEYTDRFNSISDNQKANELAAQRARNALKNRDGKKTEELYAISLTTGKDVSKITDQNYEFGVKRTEKFTADVERAVEKGEKLLFIHNHPRGLPPSVTDINELLSTPDSSGITVGHNGSVYMYTAPDKEMIEFDYDVAFRKLRWYSGDAVEDMERTLQILSEEHSFSLRKL